MELVEEMRGTFKRWESSGLSLRAFGKQEGLSYSKLMYWRKRFRDEGIQPTVAPVLDLARIEVIPEKGPANDLVSVWLPNGVSLEVSTGVDREGLRHLVEVLSSC